MRNLTLRLFALLTVTAALVSGQSKFFSAGSIHFDERPDQFLKEGQKLVQNPPKIWSEKKTCSYVASYDHLEWLILYRSDFPNPDKASIEEVKNLRRKVGGLLQMDLHRRIRENLPLLNPCRYHPGSGYFIGFATTYLTNRGYLERFSAGLSR